MILTEIGAKMGCRPDGGLAAGAGAPGSPGGGSALRDRVGTCSRPGLELEHLLDGHMENLLITPLDDTRHKLICKLNIAVTLTRPQDRPAFVRSVP